MTPQELWQEAMSNKKDPVKYLSVEIKFLEKRIETLMTIEDDPAHALVLVLKDIDQVLALREYLKENIQ